MTVQDRLLALDQGTSSTRALVFESSGALVDVVQKDFDGSYPADGWVEHDPKVLWDSSLAVMRDVLERTGGSDRIAAIGITNQRETTLLWDRNTGEPVYPAIVWQDRRTHDVCERMRAEGVEDMLQERTGLLIDPYFSATKLAWLLKLEGVRARADKGALAFGTVDSYLIWHLSRAAVHCTDATNASRTQLYNLAQQDWDEELLRYFDIPVSVLPTVCDSAGVLAHTDPQWFGRAIPICGVAGDQQAALIGQGCIDVGSSKSTYGTGCFALTNTGPTIQRSQNRLLSTVAYRLAGESCYGLEGSIFVAGAAVKWLRDQMGLIESAAQTESLARAAQGDAHGVYVVPAFTGLGAPWWDAQARGLISGLTLDSTAADVAVATLQSIVYQTNDLFAAMAADGTRPASLRIDGGMVVNDWFCQFLSDVLNVPVERPAMVETTAWGAAALAGVGCGLYADLSQASAQWQLERAFSPEMSDDTRNALLAGWSGAIARTRL